MEFAPILRAFDQFWWMVPIAIAGAILQSAWFKGLLGETLVKITAGFRLPPQTYLSFHNVTLPTADGTTQIDHVIFSRFGIFVIETKHMRGWIHGSEHEAQWTQNIFGNHYKFQNPLRQNYKHRKALEAVVGVSIDHIHSIVVFSGNCQLKSALPGNVVLGGRYVGFIKSFDTPVFSAPHVAELIRRMTERRLAPTLETRRRHIDSLQHRANSPPVKICPRCGSAMVIRKARNGPNAGGKFWGCSTYPRCKAVHRVA